MKELIVKTNNRDALDETLHSLGGLVAETPEPFTKDKYAVRTISGDIGFIKFAIKNQGYAEIVEEREIEKLI